MADAKDTNGNISLKYMLAKHGAWAFFACIFLTIVVVNVIQPATKAQEALASDRVKLLDAVTLSLQQNSATMQKNSETMLKMADAVEQLNDAIQTLNDAQKQSLNLQENSNKIMSQFAEGANDCHAKMDEKLDKIKAKMEGG